MKKKTIAILMAVAVLVGAAAGGTLAWLTAQTDSVENTFTVGNINITLTETDVVEGDTNRNNNKNDYHFVPGDVLAKDPKVTVTADSEACYLFIKVVEANNSCSVSGVTVKPIINWAIRDLDEDATASPKEKWVAYTPKSESVVGTTYYYRIIDKATEQNDVSYYLLTGDENNKNGSVTVSTEVTKEMVTMINGAKPSLKFWAAAVQYDNIKGDTTNGKTAVDVAFEQIEWPSETSESGN